MNPPGGDVRAAHAAAKSEFDRRARELGLGDVSRFFWYHAVDLGRGLVTPGTYDLRGHLPAYGFEANMSGLRVLDVGPATGFFAFEFERRGADVTTAEVPSLAALDVFPGESTADFLRKMERVFPVHTVFSAEQMHSLFHNCTAEEFYHLFIDGPFLLCKSALASAVKRVYRTIYELPDAFPERSFDLVFLGDVLLHTIDPLRALAAAARVCGNQLMIAQEMSCEPNEGPMMHYVGGRRRDEGISWWYPNYSCLEQLLQKFGFSDVRVVGKDAVLVRPSGHHYHTVVVHARR